MNSMTSHSPSQPMAEMVNLHTSLVGIGEHISKVRVIWMHTRSYLEYLTLNVVS